MVVSDNAQLREKNDILTRHIAQLNAHKTALVILCLGAGYTLDDLTRVLDAAHLATRAGTK